MSSFLMKERAIAMLAKHVTGLQYPMDHSDWRWKAQQLAEQLARENLRSVCNRYREKLEDYPDYVAAVVAGLENSPWVLPDSFPEVSAVQWIKTVDCLEYQSCDHWRDGFRNSVYEEMRCTLINTLPGYKDAAWGGPEEENDE